MSRIMLLKPEAGKTAQCAVQHGCVYVLDFDTSTVTFGRANGDLAMLFEDGSHLVLRDFYHETQLGDLFLELPDGAVISARDVIEALEIVPDDFVTGSGPVYSAELNAQADPPPVPDMSVKSFGQAPEEDAFGQDSLHPARYENGPDFLTGDSAAANPGYSLQAEAQQTFAPAPQECPDTLFTPGHSETGLFANESGEPYAAPSLSVISPFLTLEESSFASLAAADHEQESALSYSAGLSGPERDSIGAGTSGSAIFFPHASREPDLLLLEDLLDTTMPEANAGIEHVPAFAELFQASQQEEALCVRVDSFPFQEMDHLNNNLSAADTPDDCSDQLLLAFLRMGSF